jgi:hypothetical protein
MAVQDSNSVSISAGTATLTSITTNSATITGGTITGITDLAVADGGTGSSSLTLNSVLIGNGTGALLAVAPSTTGNVLTSNGTAWTSTAAAAFAAGTVIPFYNTNAPTGWTKLTTQNDKALRVVSGSGGVSGGSVAFSTAFSSQAVTGTNGASGATTLTTAQIPSHSHTISTGGGSFNSIITRAGNTVTGSNSTDATGSGDSHTHSAAAFTGTAINLAVQYIDLILCSKD